jgi:NAD(P)H-dependent FMN reductase
LLGDIAQKAKVGVVMSTTREARFGGVPAVWVTRVASAYRSLDFEVIDLRDYEMPFFNEAGSPMRVAMTDPSARRWAEKLQELDGFIFITAEYNHSPPAVLKNALDFAYTEFCRKPAAFVGYGGVGAARAIEQLRLICIELQMVSTRTSVHMCGSDFISIRQGRDPSEFPHLENGLRALLEELEWWVLKLKEARKA